MAAKVNDDVEDALDSAMQAAQDFQRSLLRIALRGDLPQPRIYKLENALDGMKRNLEVLREQAQAIEAGTAKTEGLGPKDESAVTEVMRPHSVAQPLAEKR